MKHNEFMKQAIYFAMKAYQNNEVPIGAVIVYKGEIIAYGYNSKEEDHKPTAHAEIKAIEMASAKLGSWRLDECEMYVTIEPCVMCYGAIVESRIKRVYYGAKQRTEKKNGYTQNINNSQIKAQAGILENEINEIMKEFFTNIRRRDVGYKKNNK